MRPIRCFCTQLVLLATLFVASFPAWAAQCTDVFSTTNGINSNLQASGDTLDLSGIPWANNPWPASGTTLSSGDYYYGTANLGNGYELNVAEGAQVRIFVNGSQSFGNNVKINADGGSGQLLLVTNGSLTFGNRAEVNGLFYATGSIGVGNNAQISGGLAAGGGISTGNNSSPDTDYSGVEQGLLAGLCEGPVVLSANGDSVGPVAVDVGETVLLSARGEACPAPGFFQFQRWTDRWLIDGALVQSSTSTDSLCDRSPVTRSVTFDEPGDYLVRFESLYRNCWFILGCGGSQTFGQDDIVISVTDPVGEQVDHFEILHDGVALTCQPETVTIRACANEDCDQLFTDPVQATLAPSDGWQGGNVVSINGGFGEATLQNTVAGEITLDVIGSQPSTRPQAVTLCQAGGGGLSAANCVLEFFDSGLAFDVPDLTSHKSSGPVEVRAVRRDDATQACVPAFENVERPVQLWSTYIDPDENNRPVSRALSVDGEDVSGDSGAPTTINLDFGPGGIAEMDVRYPDAGRMQLDGRYLGSAATEDEGLVMPGSDQFVSVPAGLCVRTDGECAAGDASCPLYARAGEDFDLAITAVGWQSDGDSDFCVGNPVTPNFRLLDVPLSSAVNTPAGGVDGVITPTSYSHTRSADATETVSARISEVGVFEFQATPVAGGYQGQTVPQGISAPTGRFYPDRFAVTVDPGELAAECSVAAPFSYTGQDIGWSLAPILEIEPLSVQGTRTLNYTEPGFRRLSASDVARTTPMADTTALNIEDDPLSVTANAGPGSLTEVEPGLLQFSYSTADTVRYNKLPEARVAPIEPDLEYIVTDITDADGVTGENAPYEFTPAVDFDVRYGRLTMDNVYGPENIPELLMAFRLEYWNGSRFVVNTADSCTPWTTDDITSPAEHHTLAADSGTFSGGEAGPLSLQPEGSQGTDTLTWAVEEWLQDDVNEDGALDAPSALATFGVYRGHDRVIYWRER